MKKVLFFSCWYPSKENPLKGIFVKQHAAAIKSTGINITVLAVDIRIGSSFFHKIEQVFIDEHGIETHQLIITSRLYKFIYANPIQVYWIAKNYYLKKLKELKPAIVHSNILSPCAIAGHLLSKTIGAKHIITEHWSKVDKFMSKNIFSRLGKQAYNRSEAITVVSQFLKGNISKYLNDPQKIHVIPNIVASDVYAYKEKMHGKKLVFTAVASWKLPKRPDILFEALEMFAKRHPTNTIRLNIVGEGTQLDEFKSRKWSFEVNYAGNCSKPQIAALLHESTAFLHASDIETFSVVTAEALCTGTPVLVSNVAALPELVNEQNGLLCKNDPNDWSVALEKITITSFDHKRISERAVDLYSTTKVGDAFYTLYQSI